MVSRFVFLVPALSQPRCIKRIASIKEMGYACDVYGYKRGKYDVNEYPDEINVQVLDTVSDGDYLRKAIKSWKNLSKVVASNKGEDVAFYAFGFFQAFVCAIKGVKYVYEISDIFYAYPGLNKIKWILKFIDRILIKKSALSIMTSGGFLEFFNIKENEKILIVPNKVSPRLTTISRTALTGNLDSLRFGYVGSIKYDSIFRFAETIGKYYPHYHFDFYGGATDDIQVKIDDVVSKYENVKSHGVYKNPYDLESIYSVIDIVIACYDVNSENERIAEPNKLYESLYFCKPIIVSDGIYLARRVKELGCGYTVDASSKEKIKSFIDDIKPSELVEISNREYEMPVDDIVNIPTSLCNAIKRFVDK
mgnify:CR=1 FL=1